MVDIASSSESMAMEMEMKKKKQEASVKQKQLESSVSPSYRAALRSLFSCRDAHNAAPAAATTARRRRGKSCFVRADQAAAAGEPCKRRASVSTSNASERSVKKSASRNLSAAIVVASLSSSSSSSNGGSFRSLQLRPFSGCYECQNMVLDPVINGGSMRTTVLTCHDCGEIFARPESLELHQTIRHAVCELDHDDTSRNIIEIIFQSSWLKKQSPVRAIERILKVRSAPATVARFEEYRDAIKGKASKLAKKHPRCIADGNELLRFHCAALRCPLGANGSTNLCADIPRCAVCSIIRDGFKAGDSDGGGIKTMSTSGRAHDAAAVTAADDRRAMLVCRVIAGRVKRGQQDDGEEYDSVAGAPPAVPAYSNLDELQVYSPRAILPCFVVIYRA